MSLAPVKATCWCCGQTYTVEDRSPIVPSGIQWCPKCETGEEA